MIYEYECPTCHTTREVSRKLSDPEETVTCTDCQQVCTRKWSAPGVVFNATGFYSTDNKK
jgi:putative FmdB family regulatory protein